MSLDFRIKYFCGHLRSLNVQVLANAISRWQTDQGTWRSSIHYAYLFRYHCSNEREWCNCRRHDEKVKKTFFSIENMLALVNIVFRRLYRIAQHVNTRLWYLYWTHCGFDPADNGVMSSSTIDVKKILQSCWRCGNSSLILFCKNKAI